MGDIKLRLRLSELSGLLLSLIITWYFIINGFTINGAFQIITFFFIIAICVLTFRYSSVDLYSIIWVFILIPFCWSVDNWTVATIRDLVAYEVLVVFVMFGTKTTISYDRAIHILYCMAFFHLFFVTLNYMFRDAFYSFLYKAFDSNCFPTLDKAVKGGYCTGLGYIPGDTSGYLVNGVLILFCKKTKTTNIKHIALFTLLFLGMLMCAKKSHILCLIFTILILYIITTKGGERIKVIINITIAILATFTLLYALLPVFSNIPMTSRIATAVEAYLSGQDYTSNRTSLSALAIQLFQQNPIWGIGWKYFNQLTQEKWGWTNYVNNIYIQLLTETGIIGAIMCFVPMAITLFRTLWALKEIQRYKIDYLLGDIKLSLSLQIFFLLYGIYEIPYYDFTFLFVYAIAIALSNTVIREIKNNTIWNNGGI